MNYKEHTRLDLVAGGNVFKQGDHMTLGFTPRDYEGDVVDLTGKDIEGVIYSRRKGIMFTAPADYVTAEQKIEFTIDEVLDHGEFQIEFTVTDAADPEYRRKFPSAEQDGRLIIKPSADNMDVVGVQMTTVSQLKNELQGLQSDFESSIVPQVAELKQRVDDGVGAFTEDTEVLDARMGEPNLRAFNEKLSTQLADKVGGAKKAAMDDLGQDVKEALTGGAVAVVGVGAVGTINVQTQAITAEKTTFLKNSTNLIDHTKAIKGKNIVSTSTGEIADEEGKNIMTYAVQPVESFKRFNTSRFFLYKADGTFISSNVSTSYTIPPTAEILRVSYADADLNTAQLNRGSVLLPYEKGGTALKEDVDVPIKPNSITEEKLGDNSVSSAKLKNDSVGLLNLQNGAVSLDKTDFMGRSSNLYDPRTALRGFGLRSTDGQPYADASYISTPFYEGKAGEQITTRKFNRVLFYRADQSYISRSEITDYESAYTFTMPQDGFFRLHGVDIYVDDKAQINKGDTLLDYETYYLMVDGFKIKGDVEENNLTPDAPAVKPYIFAPDEIGKDYLAKDGTYTTFTLADLYAAYDALISQENGYITKTIYGKDASGTHDVWNLKMIPREYNRNGSVRGKRPKITFIANIHGGEHPSALATYYMVKAICEDWQDNPALEYLRHNVEFEFIPVANPWGYETGEYKNYNGVNIQTNMPHNHDLRNDTDPESSTYGGIEPLSEVESQYIKSLIDDNPDALFFTDLHSAAYMEDIWTGGYDSLFYYIVPDAEQLNNDIEVAAKYSVEMNDRFLKKHYPITTNNFLSYYQLRVGKGTVDSYSAGVLGIPSFVTELFYQIPGETGVYSSDSIKATSEVLTNTFLTFLRRFKEST